MSLLEAYLEARMDEERARLRRAAALRALLATGATQRRVADQLGVSQPAISQQVKTSACVVEASPEQLIEAAGPILREVAQERGFTRLAVFGSMARGEATRTSDVDLLVQPPGGATVMDVVRLRDTFQQILGRPVDLVSYGGLRPGLDDDVLRDSVLL